MTKDPAFLFYPGDWLGGTLGMTLEEKGAYLELLICQFNSGHMTSHMVGRMVGQVFGQIQDKFKKDENGLWYNKRLDIEIEKRNSFINSRKNNLKGFNQYKKNGGHMEGHMEDENENIYKGKGGVGEKPKWAENFNNYNPKIKYPFESEKFGAIWDHWLKYKKERKDKKYTTTGEQATINSLSDKAGGSMDKAAEIVNQSIQQNWAGLFELKNNQNKEQVTDLAKTGRVLN